MSEKLKRYLIIFCFVFSSTIGCTQSYKGTIIRVIDGDTYVFQTTDGSVTVRMQGIDAPERDQPFSMESGEFLTKYLYKEATTKVTGTDRYGRMLGTLYIDGQDINLLSIKNGFSWHYKQYSKDKDYASAEENARRNILGLWGLDNPVPPWNLRKK